MAFREHTMSRFWSKVVSDLTPYVPGEQPKLANLIKLNTNENPYPPSPKVLTAIHVELGDDAARLRLYPDPNADLKGCHRQDACDHPATGFHRQWLR